MTKTRRELTPEFKREAVAPLASGARPLTPAELGVQPSMPRDWRAVQNGGAPRSRTVGSGAAPAAVAGQPGPSPADQAAEVARLRRASRGAVGEITKRARAAAAQPTPA